MEISNYFPLDYALQNSFHQEVYKNSSPLNFEKNDAFRQTDGAKFVLWKLEKPLD